MNKNEKLTHNAVRARKAQKKRVNKQDTPKKNKGWFSRLLAFIGCLLLVSALAVPCFADDAVPNSDSVVGTWVFYDVLSIPDEFYDNEYHFSFFVYDIPYEGDVGFTDFYFYYDEEIGYMDYIRIDGNQDTVYQDNVGWETQAYKTISIIEAPTDPEFITWLNAHATKVVPEADPEQVTDVWTQVMNWIVRALNAVQSVFYANGSLTFLGSLAVIGVGIAIAFLVISVVTRFLQLRG